MFKYYYLDNTLYKDKKNRNLIKIFLEQNDVYK